MSSFLTKTTLLTLFTLCLQCFVSCSKDWVELSGDTAKETGWISVNINLPEGFGKDVPSPSSTRAAANSVANGNQGDTYVGSAGDNGFNSIVLAIYNFEGAFVQTITVSASDVVGGSFRNNPFKIKAQKIKPGNYYIFAVTNPHDALTGLLAPGHTLAELQAAQDGQGPKRSSSKTVMMMCSTEFVPVVNWRIYSTKAAAEENPLRITLERFVAKIFINLKKGEKVAAPNALGGKAEFVGFKLVGVNTKSYFVRRPGKALKASGTSTTDAALTDETVLTPLVNRYAVDPNMEAVTNEAERRVHFQNDISEQSNGGWDDDSGLFATENTVNADNQKNNQLTHALVTLKYVPKVLPAGTTTWAYYKGVYMSYDQLALKFNEARNGNSTDESMNMPSGWKETVAQLYNNSVKVNNTTAESFDRYGLKFYKDGVCNYLIPIRHFTDAQQPKLNAYGRYGVVRNHLYKITINSVSGPGTLGDPPLDDTPADLTPTYISSNITVLPWTQVQQDKVVLE